MAQNAKYSARVRYVKCSRRGLLSSSFINLLQLQQATQLTKTPEGIRQRAFLYLVLGQGLRRLAGDPLRSLVQTGPTRPRQETYTFRLAGQEQRAELSDSLVNSRRPVNKPVRV